MTPEKTKRLAELIGKWRSYQFNGHTMTCSESDDLIQRLLEERAERQPVAVKERLPIEGERVILYLKDGAVEMGHWGRSMFWVQCLDLAPTTVTHWLPILAVEGD